ncbi:hypothetical protein HMPREF9151_01844 [Hoylesella saccharolytica F0055]|uniref:Uncharacterized protein n=1 Tax=Hoylesella saccharolytica F0055 TaxID=1127699 RepID=L1N6K7_9BACT|nr:hypothetical protein HMPREF9151_01844 [Hoylesella saccharolytica F0055]
MARISVKTASKDPKITNEAVETRVLPTGRLISNHFKSSNLYIT